MSSHPDIFFGATLKMNEEPYHYCVFISDITPPDNQILLVTLTELRERWEDHCVLTQEDYPLLKKKTVPAYRAAVAGPAEKFQALVDCGSARAVQAVSSECLEKIVTGAHESEEMARAHFRMLPSQKQIKTSLN